MSTLQQHEVIYPEIDGNWVYHPDGGKLKLFSRGLAALVSDDRDAETTLFIVSGHEDDPDLEAAEFYLQRGGWKPWHVKSCEPSVIEHLLKHATVSEASLRTCFMDRQTFWSKSKTNRRCAACLKDDQSEHWEW